MPDDDLDLHRLAPSVDTDHARAAFHQRRRRSNAYRPGAVAAVAVSVLVAGTVAGLALSNDDTPVETVPGDGVSDGEPGLTCDAIEGFAEQIVDVGISYDYDPSDSPEDLMELADVVFAGELTGQVATFESEDGNTAAVGYEVVVQSVYKGPEDEALTGERYIWIDINRNLDVEPFEEVAVGGVPVVVFGYESIRGPGYDAAIEGLTTACPNGPLLGKTGGYGAGWDEVDTLDDLIARLEAAATP